jgi:hypothetical protein
MALTVGLLQAQAIQVKITLDVGQMTNPDCWLNQGAVSGNKVYIHSGLCSSDPQFCNWGQDDGVGLMTFEGNNRWSITMIPATYYGQPGATPYTIGMVFRTLDGGYEGKDNNCQDIFVRNLHTASPSVIGCDGSPFTPVSVERTVLAGVSAPDYLGGLVVGPNPFRDRVTIDYNLVKKASAFSVRIYSAQGQEVVRLIEGSQVPGAHRLTWDGLDAAGRLVANGIYHMVMLDGSKRIATEKLLLMR